jgi:N-acetylglutamate synthase-like GNAT family acetyltransferase
MTALKRVVRTGTLEEIHTWIRESRPPGSLIVMDARYFVLTVPEKGRVAAVGLKRLSRFMTEVKHLVVKESERRQGHGRTILRLALERIRTPLAVATVRVDNVHWLRANVEEGFREIETVGAEGNEVRFLVRRARGGETPPPPDSPPSSEYPGNE